MGDWIRSLTKIKCKGSDKIRVSVKLPKPKTLALDEGHSCVISYKRFGQVQDKTAERARRRRGSGGINFEIVGCQRCDFS